MATYKTQRTPVRSTVIRKRELTDTFTVLVPESDYKRFESDEEAYLRYVGAIPEGQPFNGFIDMDSRPMAAESGKCCTYTHILISTCASKYTRECEDCEPAEIQTILEEFAEGGPLVLEYDFEIEVLVSPRGVERLKKGPDLFFRSLSGLPNIGEFNGTIALTDFSELESNRWHAQKWYHITSGLCKCKYRKKETEKLTRPILGPL